MTGAILTTSPDVAVLLGLHPNTIGHRDRMAARIDADEQDRERIAADAEAARLHRAALASSSG